MKPKYIFIAVFAISIIMGLLLPRIAMPAAGSTGQAAAAISGAGSQQGAELATVVAPVSMFTEVPVADITASAPPPAAVSAAAQDAPTTAPVSAQPAAGDEQSPVFIPPPEGLPTPTPLASYPNVIPISNANLSELQQLAASLANQNADQITGVYIPGILAARIVGQPNGDESYVSTEDQTLTQYGTPARYGTIGLLAHNYLSGKSFFQLKPGQQIGVTYGDGRIAYFQVSAVQAYQAISPQDIRSDFVDLSDPQGSAITYSQLFERVYTQAGKLVFQTCIEANGEISWGRIFILADPIAQPDISG